MVKVIQKDDKEPYQCDECGFHYANKECGLKSARHGAGNIRAVI